jgi:hypothetical protein
MALACALQRWHSHVLCSDGTRMCIAGMLSIGQLLHAAVRSSNQKYAFTIFLTLGHQSRSHATLGHQSRSHATLGHQSRSHATLGHQSRSHATLGRQSRIRATLGHMLHCYTMQSQPLSRAAVES